MDTDQIREIIYKIPCLKFKFVGCFPADMTPKQLDENRFFIVNTDRKGSVGTHWLLVARRNNKIYYGDSLGKNLKTYENIKLSYNLPVVQLAKSRLQKSNLCALYCIYFAYAVFCKFSEVYVNDVFVLNFFSKVL